VIRKVSSNVAMCNLLQIALMAADGLLTSWEQRDRSIDSLLSKFSMALVSSAS
jgi:hypothetical protein